MINDKKILAIIPARGGSKRLPGKNMKLLKGRPLLLWSIEAAQDSDLIDDIVVSTDDRRTLLYAEESGVSSLRRPARFSTDLSLPSEYLRHVLNCYIDYDIAVILQPTSPLRLSEDIDDAILFFETSHANSVVSVNEQREHNGAIYVLRRECYEEIDTCEESLQFVMPDSRSFDIDTIEDFALCEERIDEIL